MISVKKYKGRTPTPSGHVSCPSFDRKQEFIKANLVSTPTSHSQLKINVRHEICLVTHFDDPSAQALIRDGYRCMVTGKFDSDSLSKITELAIEFRSYQSARKDYGTTNCCHIIPASTNMNLVDDKVCYSAR